MEKVTKLLEMMASEREGFLLQKGITHYSRGEVYLNGLISRYRILKRNLSGSVASFGGGACMENLLCLHYGDIDSLTSFEIDEGGIEISKRLANLLKVSDKFKVYKVDLLEGLPEEIEPNSFDTSLSMDFLYGTVSSVYGDDYSSFNEVQTKRILSLMDEVSKKKIVIIRPSANIIPQAKRDLKILGITNIKKGSMDVKGTDQKIYYAVGEK